MLRWFWPDTNPDHILDLEISHPSLDIDSGGTIQPLYQREKDGVCPLRRR